MADLLSLLKAQVQIETDNENTCSVTLNGQVVVLSASPLTPADMHAIKGRHPDFMSSPSLEGMVDLIVRKAKHDGEKAFTAEHKPLLMRLSTGVVSAMFGELFGSQLTFDTEEQSDARKEK